MNWAIDHRVPLRSDSWSDLPYTVRKEVGDESWIEDDLISTIESQEFSNPIDDTTNGILVKSEYDNTVKFFN